LIWVNEEDQFRIISMQKGGNIGEVFQRLGKGLENINKVAKFSYSDHLGYISSCPTNLGSGFRGSIHVRLPLLSE
jgi:protein-arginine kinase